MPREQVIITMGVDLDLVRKIDDFAKQVEGRALPRSEAIRQLVRMALEMKETAEAA